MKVTETVTVQITINDAEEGQRLSDFLASYAPSETREALVQYERQRGNDLEGEADKLRAALKALVDTLSGAIVGPATVDAISAGMKAITAYDNSTHKAIPF